MFESIIKIVCEGEKISFESLLGANRKEEIVYARQLIMYFAKTHKVGSLSFIGKKFGKDHASVVHSVKSIRNYIDTDKAKREDIKQYEVKIDKSKNIITAKAGLEKMVEPLKREISEIEQRLLVIQIAFDKTLKEIEKL
jgi:esterase/lipase